jgi:hypothetical protein
MFSGRIGRDDGFGSALGEPVAQFPGVVGAIAEEALGRAADRQKRSVADQVMGVAGRQHESDGPAMLVRQGVDLRRAPAPRGANGVMMSPPFATAAERCALMWVESTLPLTTSDCPVRARKIASHTPCRLQRL